MKLEVKRIVELKDKEYFQKLVDSNQQPIYVFSNGSCWRRDKKQIDKAILGI